jgi:hypothetical protein
MWQIKNAARRANGRGLDALLLINVLIMGTTPGFSRGPRPETIEASAMGTGTQLGAVVGVTLNIYDFSTPAEKQILVQAFQKGQNQGLATALQRMRAVGHVEITGTLGYDCAYIAQIPTPTGRKIRFVTNRQIRFGEAWTDSQTMSFNLTAGEFDLDATDKSKDTGVLFPAAQLIIDKEGKLQLDLNQNAWKLLTLSTGRERKGSTRKG